MNDNRKGPDGEWIEETQWFRVELWDQAAERAAERFRKGNKVFAEGQLRVREYEGNDGQKRSSVEIRFARVISLERRDPRGIWHWRRGQRCPAGRRPARRRDRSRQCDRDGRPRRHSLQLRI